MNGITTAQGLLRLAPLVAIRGAGVAIQIGLQLLLAVVGGAGALGQFQLFQTWSTILGEAAARGLPTMVFRESARRNNEQASHALVWHAAGRICVASAIICGMVIVLRWAFPATERAVVTTVLPGLSAFALLRLWSERNKAVGRTWLAVFAESVLPPAAVCVALGALCWAPGASTPETLSIVYICGIGIALAVLVERPRSPRHATPATEFRREANAVWIASLTGLVFIHFPFVVLPMVATEQETGAFALAFKLTNIITTLLMLLGAVLGPRFIVAHQGFDGKELASVLRFSQAVSLALYLPLLAGVLVCVRLVPSFFDGDFAITPHLIWILSIGGLVNAATGLPSVLLNLTGHARLECRYTVWILSACAVIAAVFLEHLSMTHLALLYSGAIALKNGLSLRAAHRVIDALTPSIPDRSLQTATN